MDCPEQAFQNHALMTEAVTPVETKTDRVKLPFSFDVQKMQEEVEALRPKDFVYYDVLPLRAPAHMVDPSLPFPPPADDFADGSWCDWLNTSLLKDSPYILSIVEFFQQHTTVNLVRVLRLAPGALVKEHTDPTLGLQIERSMIRLTIPIFRSDEVDFFLNGTTISMKEGECWYLRLTDPHSINNKAATERINLTLDMIPNEWITSKILEHQDN